MPSPLPCFISSCVSLNLPYAFILCLPHFRFCILHSEHSTQFEFKVPSYSLHMRTNKENGVADEAIVNEWVVSIAPGDFEVVKKRWGRALLSVKYCCIATLEV